MTSNTNWEGGMAKKRLKDESVLYNDVEMVFVFSSIFHFLSENIIKNVIIFSCRFVFGSDFVSNA
jgi:hypothetical protein